MKNYDYHETIFICKYGNIYLYDIRYGTITGRFTNIKLKPKQK